jgi:thiol-disulfide isomerase/thioredoxin
VEKVRSIIRAIGVVGLLGILVMSLLGDDEPLAPGTPAPATHGTTLHGDAFDLAAWRGSVVVVNFWATWCAPCLSELPGFVDVARRHGDVRFVGLSVESPPADVERLVQRLQIPWPVVAADAATQRAWHVAGLPSTFVLSPAGEVLWSVAGGIAADDLEAVLAKAKAAAAPR